MGISLTETARIDEQLADAREGVNIFTVQGTMCHLVGMLLPIAIRTPSSAQLYFFDSDMEGNVNMRCCFGTYSVNLFFILYCDQQMRNYSKNYHTATCFDTVISSSGNL